MVDDMAEPVRRDVSDTNASGGIVLVVEDEPLTRELIATALQRDGYDVITAADGVEALARVVEFPPDLVISDVTMPNLEGVGFLRKLRADAKTNALPFIFVTSRDSQEEVVRAFDEGADDYIVKPIRPSELVARVRAKLKRPPIPLEQLSQDRRSGLLSEPAFVTEGEIEMERAQREFIPMSFAYIELFEMPEVRKRFGERGEALIARDMATLLGDRFGTLARLSRDRDGRFMMLAQTTGALTRDFLNDVSRTIVAHRFHVGTDNIRLTPIAGFSTRTGAGSFEEVRRRALIALATAATHLDLQATRFSASLDDTNPVVGPRSVIGRFRAAFVPLRIPSQVLAMLVGGLAIPFLAYWILYAHGIDVTNVIYLLCVIMLFLTAATIWVSASFRSERRSRRKRRVTPPQARSSPPTFRTKRRPYSRRSRRFSRFRIGASCRSSSRTTRRGRCRSKTSCSRSPSAIRVSFRCAFTEARRKRRTSTRRCGWSKARSSGSSTPTTSRIAAASSALGIGSRAVSTWSRATA